MSPAVSLAVFLLVIALLMILPLLPAWREWRVPSDYRSLPIMRAYTSDVDFFANAFRRQVLIETATRQVLSPSLFDFIRVPIEQLNWHAARRPLISSIAIRIREAIRCKPPLFVRNDLDVDQGSQFNALLATGAIRLGPQSEIHQWAHADGTLRLGKYCIGIRRLSSNTLVELDDGCLFERISAPTVRFGLEPPDVPRSALRERHRPSDLADLPGAQRRTATMWRIDGDCVLPPGRIYTGSLVVTGHLTIGEDTVVLGDIKARKGIHIGRHVRIEGAVVCEQDIDVRSGTFLHGPVVAEAAVTLGGGVRIGSRDQRTTVSASAILAESGVISHGTVWARDAGLVWPA